MRNATCSGSMGGSQSAAHVGEGIVTLEAVLILLLIGAIAGWLAGVIVKGRGLGLIGNIVIGILGAFIANWLLPQVGIVIGGGIVASIINAMIGAVILLIIVMALRRA